MNLTCQHCGETEFVLVVYLDDLDTAVTQIECVNHDSHVAEILINDSVAHELAGGVPAAVATGDPDWYIAQQAQDVMWHRDGPS